MSDNCRYPNFDRPKRRKYFKCDNNPIHRHQPPPHQLPPSHLLDLHRRQASDERLSFFLDDMDGLSTVDGFVQVNEGLEEMTEYVANEPSVGLFFVQQHAQNAMPILISAKDKIVEKSREVALHTEDLEDSISVVNPQSKLGISDE
ncbi:hypothetical protein QJS04_geneDACA011577 [Acorus gramineus]|uniref:Uncharacterized protein n=1 Tax=Acorus gramineus TaxID=55184 RepID=A0AAV9AFF1_ACOGR|nr:hypothetical protein QJS04_geneDACA011577 [Acorus gramineus]